MDERQRTEIVEILKAHYPYRKLPELDIQAFIDQSTQKSCEDGEIIFHKKDDARYLYVIIQGTIRFSEETKDGEKDLALLTSGDTFGYEMLGGKEPCMVNATAVGKNHLLLIDQPEMQAYLKEHSNLSQPLEILYDSYYFFLKKHLEWVKPEEVVYYISRKHWITLIFSLIPWFIFSIITVPLSGLFALNSGMTTGVLIFSVDLLIVIFWAIWVIVDWSNDYSVITNRRVSFQEKVVLLYNSRVEAPLNMVLSVSTSTTLLGRWFSYGDVLVRTYAGLITLPKVKNSQQVADLLEAAWFWARVSRTKEEKSELAKMIRQRLGYDRNAKKAAEQSVEPTKTKGKLSTSLSNMFRMRSEQGGVITYRKHWFILLEKIFFPTLAIVALFFFLSLRTAGYFSFISMAAFSALILLGVIFSGLWWLYAYVDWHNDYFVVTAEQILDVYKKPLGQEKRQAAPIKNIQSIEFDRHGIFGILLNYGSVYIRIGDASMVFADIYNPSEAQQDLFRRYSEMDYKEKQEKVIGDRERILEMLQIYHRVVEEEDVYKEQLPPPLN
jgi:hypothetical protein